MALEDPIFPHRGRYVGKPPKDLMCCGQKLEAFKATEGGATIKGYTCTHCRQTWIASWIIEDMSNYEGYEAPREETP